MSTATIAGDFKGWVKKYLLLKQTPPAEGQEILVKEGEKIRFSYNKDQDLLSATLDIATERDAIVNEDGSFRDPSWRLITEDSKVKNGLRVIIEGPEKNLYIEWPEHVVVRGVRIQRTSKTGSSVIGELILES